jgi:hypothetical protein
MVRPLIKKGSFAIVGYLSRGEFEKRFEIAENEKAGRSTRKEFSVRVVSGFT